MNVSSNVPIYVDVFIFYFIVNSRKNEIAKLN